MESAKSIPSKNTCEGSAEVNKEKSKRIDENEESSHDEQDDELDEYLAFLSKKFSKLRLKRNPAAARPSRNNYQPNKNLVDRSKFKYFNCGMAEHFANECSKPKAEKKEKEY